MNKHTVTLPDGTVRTRNSKSKVYSHAVVAKMKPGSYHYEQGIRWGVMGWSSRLDLAQKVAKKWGVTHEVQILEAEKV